MREFKEQVKGTSFENVTCDRERRKKTNEKVLNVLANRKRTPPPEASMVDLTPCEDNSDGNSNRYDHIPRTSGNINFSDLFKALEEDDKKVLCRAEKPVKSLSTAGKINTSGNDTSLHMLDSGDEELVNILQSFETEKTP